MAEPKLLIPPVVEHQLFWKDCPLQVAFHFNALHADPGITPGSFAVSFIVNQFAGADQKGVSFLQTEYLPSGLVDAGAFQYIVNQIPIAHNRAVTVAGGAVFITAGVDHGVNVSGKIVGKVIVLHKKFPPV